jgi:GT2 family glycosyltransferase
LQFSIIIPVYNKIEIIGRCIQTNISHCAEPQEWIIIDNASDQNTKSGLNELKNFAEKEGHIFNIITETENTGVARAWNKGLANAFQPNVCILNNDCVLMPNWDKIALAEIELGKLAIFSPFVLEPPMFKNQYGEDEFLKGKKNWSYFLEKNQNRYRKGYFDGIVFLGQKTYFESVGAFDEYYWLTMEDIDFEHRALQKQIPIGKTGNLIAFHHISATRKSMNVNEEKNSKHFEEKFGFNFSQQEAKWINKMIRSYEKRLFKVFGTMGTFAKLI